MVPRYRSVMIRKKPGVTAKYRAKRRRAAVKDNGKIRAYVFAREEGICRCCRLRAAESMHELRFRSLGGKVSKSNSVAVCGALGTTGCHGYLQRNEIDWSGDAQQRLSFQPNSKSAADWMRIKLGLWVMSMPGGRNEEMPA